MKTEQERKARALSKALTAKRERKNHSQETAAQIIGVSTMTLSRWERTVNYPAGRNVIRAVLEYLARKELP